MKYKNLMGVDVRLILVVGIFSASTFGQSPALKSSITSTTSINEFEKATYEETTSGESVRECFCTPINKCKSYVPREDGGGLIDKRIPLEVCAGYLDVCCYDPPESQTEKYTTSTEHYNNENHSSSSHEDENYGKTPSDSYEDECICTPFNLCKSYVPAADGHELIDIRINLGSCRSYMDVCCNDTKISPPVNHEHSEVTSECNCNKDKNDEYTGSHSSDKHTTKYPETHSGHHIGSTTEHYGEKDHTKTEDGESHSNHYVGSKPEHTETHYGDKHHSTTEHSGSYNGDKHHSTTEHSGSYNGDKYHSTTEHSGTYHGDKDHSTKGYPETHSGHHVGSTTDYNGTHYGDEYHSTTEHSGTYHGDNNHSTTEHGGTYHGDKYHSTTERDGTYHGDKYHSTTERDGTYHGDKYHSTTERDGTNHGDKYHSTTERDGTYHGDKYHSTTERDGTYHGDKYHSTTERDGTYHENKDYNKTGHSETYHKCGVWNREGLHFKVINAYDGESQYGEYPSMVAIFLEEVSKNGDKHLKYHCGGSLIKKNVVLTATHCLHGKDQSTLVIRAGEWDLKSEKEIYSHQDRRVSKIVSHPNYYAGLLENDISLIFTDKPFYLQENIQTICLPEEKDDYSYKHCFSSGWGKTVSHFNNYTIHKKTHSGNKQEIAQYPVSILKKVEVPIVPREKCIKALRTTRLGPIFKLHESFICAGGEEGKDTCRGDGGSPLMCPSKHDKDSLVQVGIVAWGINCGLADIPAVYVDVAYFSNWINKEIEHYSKY